MRLCIWILIAAVVSADIYLHSPRGSNNRLDDENRDRNNANRMFDSQNNNRGGSNVGQVYYYVGSKVEVEWTAQHGCNNANTNCELILQYMCDDRIRDGTTQKTIPINPKECYNWDCDTDVRFGRHESVDSYLHCKQRERNKGLFTASQNLKGSSAIYTRQNPNGARRGLECPEERDYYPYWGPSDWTDIAILTDNTRRCESFEALSQNAQPVSYCHIENMQAMVRSISQNTLIPQTQDACETFEYYDKINNETVTGKWKLGKAQGAEGGRPECQVTSWSRDNHLGNGMGGQTAKYTWTVPNHPHEQCVMRIRYNITTGDIDLPYNDVNEPSAAVVGLTAENNEKQSGTGLCERYGMCNETSRGYKNGKNNPKVVPLQLTANDPNKMKFQLAINTAQYGRTFQDRTHRFAIRPRPGGVSADAGIQNLQVRGKRGNIVQTFPGTEYDFTPNELRIGAGDYVHIQWTGSNTNPNNNAGQGRQGSDRSNICLLRPPNYNEDTQSEGTVPVGQYGNSYPAMIPPAGDTNSKRLLSMDTELLKNLCTLKDSQFGGEMSELDDAGTYFDAGLYQVKPEDKGVYHYLSTRNNNFSNRSQKGKIVVVNAGEAIMDATIPATGASVDISTATLEFPPQSEAAALTLQTKQTEIQGKTVLAVGVQNAAGTADVGAFEVCLDTSSLKITQSPRLVQSANINGPWEKVDAEVKGSVICGSVSNGGFYAVQPVANAWFIVVVVVVSILVISFVGFVIHKKKQAGMSDTQSHLGGGRI